MRLSVVDHHRQIDLAGEPEHDAKGLLLHLNRHLVVPRPPVIVETDLTHRDRSRIPRQLSHRLELRGVGRSLLVRMPAHGGKDAIELVGALYAYQVTRPKTTAHAR